MTSSMGHDELELVDSWWRAANYLSVGQIYLRSNPLLREPLKAEHTKSRLLGHWGTTPGLNFVYAHLNRVIRRDSAEMLFVAGPGHGGPAVVANAWLEGTYSEIYGHVGNDADGMAELFRQFSYPGGIPSHAAPETPGSISEGGELGYSLAHAYGSVLDNPQLVTAVVIGDGEAETGPLAASWHSHNFLDPAADGAVLPILHLNGYKIANPTILARMPEEQLEQLLRGYGHEPYFVTVKDPDNTEQAHRDFAEALDRSLAGIRAIQESRRAPAAGTDGAADVDGAPRWPMIVLRSPKGWTGPRIVDGLPVEGTWRSHQVPLSEVRTNGEHLKQLEEWLQSYRPAELFDGDGRLRPDVAGAAPAGSLRMSATPHANGGLLRKALKLPAYRDHAVEVPEPGTDRVSPMITLGSWMRDVISLNMETFRLFGPDETASNRLQNVYEVTDKVWQYRIDDVDEHLARSGRVMEVLSEHLCQGWLEGYLLTGRHGVFSCYEAFIHIVDSMFNQHAKWLKVHRQLPWRQPVPSLNYLLSSHVWQQDHNGFSHQDPGFIDHAVNKKAEVIRVYLPADANTLLCVMAHCLASTDYVNIVVSGKQPSPTWLGPADAANHCRRGLGIWDFAGSEVPGEEPDVVMACAGDVPTVETVAAAELLKEGAPGLKVRVVNVVDLMRLQDESEHPHGLPARDFDGIFTADKPIIFAYHGYPALIHRLAYRRNNQDGLHVRGYKEEGTTTTPFDMAMLNGIDRFQLAIDAIDRVPGLAERHSSLRQSLQDRRMRAREHTRTHGEDPEEIRNWTLG
ncbi:xylulose-5-phosphate/fructose-6-phosphate phosphoketolase [Pseudarthrobacter oxydans]|uniref:Probable phosphoketolase n=1 Tax=Pseudarthrobacter oxydans TaxID=1671 RepID=A0AAW8NAC9_PSEOX|nr:phosphoketolase family protein [Pseudarthrobacter oxydans]MBD1592665.1 phosphoketolase family protein [Arthrobacter sp. S1_S22]MDR6791758.1 xylulose-5-phosphate/fructose-6-phosphate phosphoketolase [Pseudarthrobacter oxydans]MDR7163172.1 xylulose-5-phosphate/fructose-6-phosphate phosphoketolase [Pseudarthrobacter oxydans]